MNGRTKRPWGDLLPPSQLRGPVGLTQQESAHRAGISVRHYQSFEAGALNVSFLVLRAVAGALETTPARLTEGAGRSRAQTGAKGRGGGRNHDLDRLPAPRVPDHRRGTTSERLLGEKDAAGTAAA